MSGLPQLNWRKSSYSSGNGGACVEVATAADGDRYLRDSKNPNHGTHHFTATTWRTFLHGLQAGE